MSLDRPFCKGKVGAAYRRGATCCFRAAKDGYCRRHHPREVLRQAEVKLATAYRRLNEARAELVRAQNAVTSSGMEL